jgi:glycolate oxidase FAD binding subunit
MTVSGDNGSSAGVLQPRDEQDLVELIAGCAHALEPIGFGSKREIGQPVDAVPLSLDALSGVESYEPQELVLSVRPATPLAQIDSLLASQGQRLAFEPPPVLLWPDRPRTQSLGGVLAGNLSGSRRVCAGAARDHFLGFTAVNGRAERFVGGGRVVKNVTGYDLPKLLAGSWGTLAVLTSVTVRTAPLPESELTLRIATDDVVAGAAMLRDALRSTCEVSSAAFALPAGVALRLEGLRASVRDRAAALLRELGVDAGDELCDGDSHGFWRDIAGARALAAWPVVWRLSVPPANAVATVAALAPEQWLMDWGGGLIWAAFAEVDARRVRGALSAGGHATLYKAPQEQRCEVAVFQPPAPGIVRMSRRLKVAFDPDNRLNPGRMDPDWRRPRASS